MLVHGLDQLVTGIGTVITGKHRLTATEHLLQNAGVSPEWASLTNDILTIGGTMGGTAIIRNSRYINQTAALVAKSSGGNGSFYNRAAFERYKTLLRAQMEKPYVVDPELNKLVNFNYRPHGKIGSGSTAAAIRHEVATGERVVNKLHSQKGREMINRLEKWLRNNPTARSGDRAAAENIIKDLRNSLGE